MSQPPPPPVSEAKPTPWHQEPVVILVLAFTLLGPFAIPMIWRSPKFTKGAKIALSLLLIALSLAALAILAWVAWILFAHLQELADLSQQLGV